MYEPEPRGDERTLATLAHLGGVAGLVLSVGFLGWVVPLVLYLWKRTESPFVAFHALQALLFHLAWIAIFVLMAVLTFVLFISLIAIPLALVLIPVGFVLGIVPIVWAIVAAVRANSGDWYRFPVVGEFALRSSR